MGMGLTAERVAAKYNVSREEQDAFSLESHRRAAAAIDAGKFKDEIVPVTVKRTRFDGKRAVAETVTFDTDEGVRRDTSMEALAGLRPAFKQGGSVTAGNSSQTSDGAAAVMVMSAQRAEELGLKPMAVYRSFAVGGVDPDVMGIGPVEAVPKALKLAGISLGRRGHHRAQRGVRGPVAAGHAGAGHGPRKSQRQRRRHRAGPPAGLHRRPPDGDHDVRSRAGATPATGW